MIVSANFCTTRRHGSIRSMTKVTQSVFGGQWAMVRFIEAVETSDEMKRKQLMDEILKYNEEDLGATWVVFRWLREKALEVRDHDVAS